MRTDVWFQDSFKILSTWPFIGFWWQFSLYYRTDVRINKIIALFCVELYERRQCIMLSISILVGRGKEMLPVILISDSGTVERILGHKWGSEVLMSILSPIFRIKRISSSLFFFFFLSFSFLATPQHMEFPGQESDPRRSHDLSLSCSNTGSLTHCARLEIESVSQCSQDTAHPIVPQGELHTTLFLVSIQKHFSSPSSSPRLLAPPVTSVFQCPSLL